MSVSEPGSPPAPRTSLGAPGAAEVAAALGLEGAEERESGSPELLWHHCERVAVLTLNRPEARNAMTLETKQALLGALVRIAEDPETGCVLLRGAGSAFCSGGDTKKMARDGRPPSMEDRQRQLHWEHRIPRLLHDMGKPTLCALRGAAAGAGFALALSCDLRLASEDAFLLTSFARLGLSGDYGGSWFLTRLVGPARARELYFLSERLPAREAFAWGLVNRVLPDGELDAAAFGWARRMAAGPPVAHRFMKGNLNRALELDLDGCLAVEADRMVRGAMTEDYQEAVRAFQEGRSPRFRGR